MHLNCCILTKKNKDFISFAFIFFACEKKLSFVIIFELDSFFTMLINDGLERPLEVSIIIFEFFMSGVFFKHFYPKIHMLITII